MSDTTELPDVPMKIGELARRAGVNIQTVRYYERRGLLADGRFARLAVKVPDRPGNLARLTQLVAEAGANVVHVAHRRAYADISVRDVEIVMHLETRGRDHVQAVVALLERHGFRVEEDA